MYSVLEESTFELVSRLFPEGHRGIYVDIGAGYPEWYSNSYPFRALGWTVIAIEPQPHMCNQFRERGFEILQFACSDRNEGIVPFEILDSTGGLAGSSFKILDDHPRELITTIEVEARTLTSLMEEFYPHVDHIDVLDVDVEYYELQVLRGVDFNKFAPGVLVIENLPTNSGIWVNPHRDDLYAFYNEIGYKIVGQAGFNEILIRRDDDRLPEWIH